MCFLSTLLLSTKIKLAGSKINSFYFQDSNDNIWVSDLYGWNKYNGILTQSYSSNDVASGIKGNYIQSSLFEDRQGNLWSSTYEYLIKYSPKLNRFESLRLSSDNKELVSGYHVIYVDKNANNLWVKIDEEILIIDLKTMNCISKVTSSLNSRRFKVHYDKQLNTYLVLGFPWNENFGFEKFNIKSDSISNHTAILSNSNHTISDGIKVNDQVWLVSNKGLLEIDLTNYNELTVYNPTNTNITFNNIDTLNNEILITSDDFGLWSFNLKDRVLIQKVKPDDLLDKSPVEIFIDNYKGIWLSYRDKGVQRIFFDSRSNTIKQLPYTSGFSINNLLNISSQTILIATEKNDLYFIDNTTSIKSHEQYNSKKFPITNIQDIRYSEGNLYLMDLNNIYKYILGDDSSQLIFNNNKGQLYNLEKDQNQNLVVSTSLGALMISPEGIENTDNQNSEYCFEDVSVNVIPFKDSYLIFDGNISDSLFFCNSSTSYAIDEIGWLNSSYIDNEKGTAFLSTQKGLFTFDDNRNFKRIFPVLENHDDSDITGFTLDHGNYWVTSKHNIYHISSDKTIIRIPIFKELTFSNSSPLVLSDNVLFGTDKGVYKLDKKIIQELRSAPKIQLKKITYNNEELDLRNIKHSKLITLPYSQQSMDMQFDISEYYGDNNQTLQFQLNGYHESKQYSKDGSISFTNLAPGNYELSAIAIGSNRKFSKEEIFKLKITPPYHQTWWFRSLIALSLLGVGFGFNYFRTRQQLKEKQIELDRQKALQDQRNRMSRDLHDEMGSGLTKIKYLTKSVTSPEEKETSKQIDNLATNLIGNMRELLWSLDEGYDSSSSLLVKIREISNQYRKSSDLNIKTLKDTDFQNVQISGLVRRNIVLIVKECLTNVLKHANASEVLIKAQSSDKNLIITIVDNGIGFNTLNTSKSGQYGLNSIRRRIKDLNGSVQIDSNSNGTTILLSVPHLGLLLK